MEFLAAGQADHAARQEEGDVHSDHLQPDPRHRFRRSPGGIHTAAAAGGRDRLRRPVRLHGLRPRRGARSQQQLGAQSVSLRHPAEYRVLLPGSARRGAGAHSGRARRAEVLRSRDGSRSQPQHGRELPYLSGAHPQGVRRDGGRDGLSRDRRHPVDRAAAAGDAPHPDARTGRHLEGRSARSSAARSS